MDNTTLIVVSIIVVVIIIAIVIALIFILRPKGVMAVPFFNDGDKVNILNLATGEFLAPSICGTFGKSYLSASNATSSASGQIWTVNTVKESDNTFSYIFSNMDTGGYINVSSTVEAYSIVNVNRSTALPTDPSYFIQLKPVKNISNATTNNNTFAMTNTNGGNTATLATAGAFNNAGNKNNKTCLPIISPSAGSGPEPVLIWATNADTANKLPIERITFRISKVTV